ncbi:MAG TPA: creatininase family protein [Trueperaceae bacterium]|nr:creatininase family protein [Trueperaceae bacterium]
MAKQGHYRYEKMSWPEIDEAAVAGKVVIIPAATLEDHGRHLPVDTDVVLAEGVCSAAARRIPDEVVVLPPITHGYSPHHIDFPGTITINWKTFVDYVLDVTRSLVHHGFRKILLVNGHGSNRPVLDMAARLTVIEHPHAHCGALSWWELTKVREVFATMRESEWVAHACELETSVYLALDPDHVNMDKAEKDTSFNKSPHFWSDLAGAPPAGYRNAVGLTEFWSTVTRDGVKGDPTYATAAKGQALLDAAADELVAIIREFRERPIARRVAHQSIRPPTEPYFIEAEASATTDSAADGLGTQGVDP